ncbi:MAG: hypothetical protein ABEJ89_10660 [Haloarculaceae archaeon]
MPAYDRSTSEGCREIDRWDRGVGWLAHPDEPGRRAGHAVRGPASDGDGEGVWLLDPLDGPGVADLVADLGAVVGVAVLSGYHARDAGAFARRHGVPVHVPAWVDRPVERIDAPVERTSGSLAGFELRRLRPLRAWHETVAYRRRDGTLYVPDVLTAEPDFRVGDERVAMNTFSRLRPPRGTFADLEPERILFGHGEGVFEDATAALRSAFAGARRRFPRALVQNAPAELRLMLGALR